MAGTKRSLLLALTVLLTSTSAYAQTQMSGTVNVRSILNPVSVQSREDVPPGSSALAQFSTPILGKIVRTPIIYSEGTLQHFQLDLFGRLLTRSSFADAITRAPGQRDPAVVVIRSAIPDPQCPNTIGFSQTASTQQITAPLGQQIFICTVAFISAGAQNVSIVSGTGSTCATGSSGIIGGTTASLAVAANGGMALPAIDIQFQVKTGDNVCVLQSAANNVSGTITWTTRTP